MNVFRGQLAHGIGGGLFVVTSDGFTRPEDVRSGPGAHHGVVGNREVGSIVTSHETSVQSTMSGTDSWQRIGINEWISSVRGSVESQFSGLIRMPQTNMIPARVYKGMMTVVTNNTAIRRGPGTVFPEARPRLNSGVHVTATHRATPPLQFSGGLSTEITGDWIRVEVGADSGWIWHANLLHW